MNTAVAAAKPTTFPFLQLAKSVGRRAALLLLAALTCTAMPAHALVLGITEGVTYRATDSQIEAKFEPIAELLSKAIKQPVTIKVLSSYASAREALRSQQLDMAFVHPTHVAMESAKSGQYKTLAWTTGFTQYTVSFLCNDKQPIGNWKELTGKTLVMPDADSITAVITRAMLREKGVKSTELKLSNTRYQDAVPFYLQNGFANYGATASASVVKNWKSGGGNTCAESRPVPIKQWLTSTKLDAAITDQLRTALVELAQSDAGKRALATSGYSGFVAPSAEVEKALMSWLAI